MGLTTFDTAFVLKARSLLRIFNLEQEFGFLTVW